MKKFMRLWFVLSLTSVCWAEPQQYYKEIQYDSQSNLLLNNPVTGALFGTLLCLEGCRGDIWATPFFTVAGTFLGFGAMINSIKHDLGIGEIETVGQAEGRKEQAAEIEKRALTLAKNSLAEVCSLGNTTLVLVKSKVLCT